VDCFGGGVEFNEAEAAKGSASFLQQFYRMPERDALPRAFTQSIGVPPPDTLPGSATGSSSV